MTTLPQIAGPGSLSASDNTYSTFTADATGTKSYQFQWAGYASKSFAVDSQDSAPVGVEFSSDGTKMFIAGQTNSTVYQYILSTAWNVSTASYASKSYSVSTQTTSVRDIAFSSDGTKMYVGSSSDNTVYQYSLSTAWDVSTSSYASKSVVVTTGATSPALRNIVFRPNGSTLFVNNAGVIAEWSLSTAWDVSTASYVKNKSGITTPSPGLQAIAFNSTGTVFYSAGVTNDDIYKWTMSTAWDISTLVVTDTSMSIASQEGTVRHLVFSADETAMYLVGITNDTVYQYDEASRTVVPTDFKNMDTLSWAVESSRTVTGGDDTLNLLIRIMSGSTVLAADNSGGTFQSVRAGVTGTTDTRTPTTGSTAFSYVNTSATKAQWNAATLELQQTFTASMTADGHAIRVDQVLIDGTYTTTGGTGIETGYWGVKAF